MRGEDESDAKLRVVVTRSELVARYAKYLDWRKASCGVFEAGQSPGVFIARRGATRGRSRARRQLAMLVMALGAVVVSGCGTRSVPPPRPSIQLGGRYMTVHLFAVDRAGARRLVPPEFRLGEYAKRELAAFAAQGPRDERFQHRSTATLAVWLISCDSTRVGIDSRRNWGWWRHYN